MQLDSVVRTLNGSPLTTFLLALVPLCSYVPHYCFEIYHSNGKGYPAFVKVPTKQIANLRISYEPPLSVKMVRWTVSDCLCLGGHTHVLRTKGRGYSLGLHQPVLLLIEFAGCSDIFVSIFKYLKQ